jgi:LysR family transcriptional activator of nhaA
MPLNLNHQHLLYFSTVARLGSIAKASAFLHLTPQTISAQIKLLERDLGIPLFERVGRGLSLTPTGQVVQRYAEEIFGLSRELVETIRSGEGGISPVLRVGVSDALPKLVCHQLLKPALMLEEGPKIICREEGMEQLLADLAVHRLDLLLADSPLPAHSPLKAFNHLLGQAGVVWMAALPLAKKLRRGFPQSLNGAPVLLPAPGTALRRNLDTWLAEEEIHPRIIAEFQDPALMETFGQAGEGAFVVSESVATVAARHFSAMPLGKAKGVLERFYAISVERRVRHRSVAAICDTARGGLFEQN